MTALQNRSAEMMGIVASLPERGRIADPIIGNDLSRTGLIVPSAKTGAALIVRRPVLKDGRENALLRGMKIGDLLVRKETVPALSRADATGMVAMRD